MVVANFGLTFFEPLCNLPVVGLTKNTIEKLADVLIRLGEASLIGSLATVFVQGFPHVASAVGVLTGLGAILLGLYVNNLKEERGV